MHMKITFRGNHGWIVFDTDATTFQNRMAGGMLVPLFVGGHSDDGPALCYAWMEDQRAPISRKDLRAERRGDFCPAPWVVDGKRNIVAVKTLVQARRIIKEIRSWSVPTPGDPTP